MSKMKTLSVLSAALILFGISCSKKDSSVNQKPTVEPARGLYVLNEGSFTVPNSTTLTYYDDSSAKATTDFYQSVNNTVLGSTGNDILIFGTKLYIVMNGSNNITVMDKNTAKLIKQITASDGAQWQPRYAIPYNNKLLVSAYDGTVSVIDTSSLEISNTIKVGSDPEGLCTVGNTLYVVNSGGLNYPDYDSTVSVVDLTTLTETQKMKIAVNGKGLAVNPTDGYIYEATLGNYADITGKIYVINGNELIDSLDIQTSGIISIFNDKAYVFNMDYTTNKGSISTIDLHTKGISNFITDGTAIKYPYGINIDESNGDVYVTDAADGKSAGKVYCFDKTGKQKFSFDAGVFPDKVVFLRD